MSSKARRRTSSFSTINHVSNGLVFEFKEKREHAVSREEVSFMIYLCLHSNRSPVLKNPLGE